MSVAVLSVDLDGLEANWQRSARAAAPARLAAVIKADAYGLGTKGVAPCLYQNGAHDFFTAHVDEAVIARACLPDHSARIYILNGFCAEDFALTQQHDLIPVLSAPEEVQAWRAATKGLGPRPRVAVQFDTGMNRLGLEPNELDALNPFDDLNVCLVLSHLSVADDPEHSLNAAQVRQFEAMSAHFPRAERSLLNSPGLIALDGPRFDMVRNGIALFAQNVATLRARIIQVRDVAPGEVVGYGAAWRASRPSRIATISLGYADGYDRGLGGRARMWLERAAIYAPLVGRVSMDLITLDVTDAGPDLVKAGDWVEAFGAHVPLSEIADLADTIDYECLVRISPRVRRIYGRAGSAAFSAQP